MAVGGPKGVAAGEESGPSKLVVRRPSAAEAVVMAEWWWARVGDEGSDVVVAVVAGTDEGVEESESGRAGRSSSAGGAPGWTGVGASSVTWGQTMGTSAEGLRASWELLGAVLAWVQLDRPSLDVLMLPVLASASA